MVCWCLCVCLCVRAWSTRGPHCQNYRVPLYFITFLGGGTRGGVALDAHISPCSASNSAVGPRAHMSWERLSAIVLGDIHILSNDYCQCPILELLRLLSYLFKNFFF